MILANRNVTPSGGRMISMLLRSKVNGTGRGQHSFRCIWAGDPASEISPYFFTTPGARGCRFGSGRDHARNQQREVFERFASLARVDQPPADGVV